MLGLLTHTFGISIHCYISLQTCFHWQLPLSKIDLKQILVDKIEFHSEVNLFIDSIFHKNPNDFSHFTWIIGAVLRMNEHMVSKLLFLRKLFSHHWNSIYFWPADVFSSYIRAFQMVLILGNSCNLNKKDFNSFMSFLRRKPPFSCLQARTISYYVST